MKFTATLTVNARDLNLQQKDDLTERIREFAYPKDFEVKDGKAIFTVEWEADDLNSLLSYYNETLESVRLDLHGVNHEWNAQPTDPIAYAKRVARDVIEWERHFDAVMLPEDLRDALSLVAAYNVD